MYGSEGSYISVSNNQQANQTTFNTAFVSRTNDDNTTGKKDLQNADAASGPDVINVQREINSLNSYSGRPSGSVYNVTPTWVNTDVGASGDNLQERADALTERFNETTGHTHDGTAGNGGQISALNLSDINLFRAVRVTDTVNSGTSSTLDVSTNFLGKTPGGDATTAGVATGTGVNRVWIANATDETAITDAGGQVVYGRITESSGTWTLSYYTNEAGVETAYTFGSDTPLRIYYNEVFTLAGIPTFNADAGYIQSLDFGADIPNASATQRGLVSTGAQDFAGAKTFNASVRLRDAVYLDEVNNTQSGSTVTLTNPAVGIIRVTNASLVSIAGVAAPSFNQVIAIFNATGVDLQIENDNAGTAVDGILTGTGAAFDFLINAAVLLMYDVTTTRWRMIGGGGGGGGGGQFVTDAFTGTTITSTADGLQKWRYTGGSAQTITAIDPTSAVDGALLHILGTSDTNTITLNHTDSAEGFLLNGTWVGYLGSQISLQWDSTLDRWVEVSRNGI